MIDVIHIGVMVRAGGSAMMKVVDISDGDIAECVFIDGSGFIRHRYYHVDRLQPFWMSLGPKSLWPEAGNLSAVEAEKEERAAAAERKAKAAATRKARRSNKIKRTGVTA